MSQTAASTGLFASSIPRANAQSELHESARPRRISWPETFANEQVRGLVRQLFLSEAEKRSRHILFSSTDRETDVACVCRMAGEALALENVGNVAVLGSHPYLYPAGNVASEIIRDDRRRETTPLRQASFHTADNLWVIPNTLREHFSITSRLHSAIAGLRREFEYSIIAGPVADSHEALMMAQMADGVVLVLSAHYTRRATARKIKHVLESVNARILGTVLIDRVFPIPENIYRRL